MFERQPKHTKSVERWSLLGLSQTHEINCNVTSLSVVYCINCQENDIKVKSIDWPYHFKSGELGPKNEFNPPFYSVQSAWTMLGKWASCMCMSGYLFYLYLRFSYWCLERLWKVLYFLFFSFYPIFLLVLIFYLTEYPQKEYYIVLS